MKKNFSIFELKLIVTSSFMDVFFQDFYQTDKKVIEFLEFRICSNKFPDKGEVADLKRKFEIIST